MKNHLEKAKIGILYRKIHPRCLRKFNSGKSCGIRKTVTASYDTLGRQSGFGVSGDSFDVAVTYDAMGRGNSMTWNYGAYTSSYLANSNLPSSLSMPGNLSANFSYEANRNLIANVDNKDASNTTISKYAYVNDAIGNRTSMAKTGTAFAQADTITYGYNSKSEVTSAAAQNDTTYNYAYNFDQIGNRLTASERGTASTYAANNLNQYTAVNAAIPTYDNDGNMLTNVNGWTYTWDAENRLATAVSGTTTITFKYDYMSRRVVKTVSTGGSVTSSKRYVYSGYKHIETLDAANSNALLQKYLWSGDRILATYDTANNAAYSYLIDANKNIGQLVDASGNAVAKYEYGPFGQITAQSGTYAETNPYRFSSEQYDSDLGLVYYNYRYYSPDLGRWLSKDPIAERGGLNLYAFIKNTGVNGIDSLGLDEGDGGTPTGCCAGKKMYTGAKCCKDSQYMPGLKCCYGGKTYFNKEVDTGVSINVGYLSGHPIFNPWVTSAHTYVEYGGKGFGLYSKSATYGTDSSVGSSATNGSSASSGTSVRKGHSSGESAASSAAFSDAGEVKDSDLTQYPPNDDPKFKDEGTYSIRERVKLNPCEYDIEKFQSCVSRWNLAGKEGLGYMLVGFNCRDFANTAVSTCKDAAKR